MASSGKSRQHQTEAMSQSPDVLRVNRRLSIPVSEFTFRATRSGGPGGQHANRSATRVQLFWDVAGSPSLSERRRQLLLSRLGNRIDAAGVLQLSVDTHRSQHRNREEAVERLRLLVSEALRTPKARVPTKPTKGSRERRLREKKRRGEVKKLRGRVRDD